MVVFLIIERLDGVTLGWAAQGAVKVAAGDRQNWLCAAKGVLNRREKCRCGPDRPALIARLRGPHGSYPVSDNATVTA